MLPLDGSTIPDSAAALAGALSRGLAAAGMTPREVIAEGTWPALDLLRIDLTGVQISRPKLPGSTSAQTRGSFTAARFELVATPGNLEGTPAQISLHADNAAFDLASVQDGASALLIKRAAQGEVAVEVVREDLERLLHSLASKAASEHGVEIKSVKLSLTSRGNRAVSVKADVTAKMFIATATVTLTGDVDLDDQLQARLSNLCFSGDGMVANLAGGFIRPQLAKLEGRTFPLVSFALGEITLRDMQLRAGDPLRLSTQFGS